MLSVEQKTGGMNKKQQNDTLKPNHSNNHIKYKCSKCTN